MKLKGCKIAVLGLGREGAALAAYFKSEDIEADFLDEKVETAGIEFDSFNVKVGATAFSDLGAYDLIFRSPGISPHRREFTSIKGKVTSLTRLFCDLWPGKIIGVTGTKGKGTTASLIKSILGQGAVTNILVGNIGSVTLVDVEKYDPCAVAIMELSSFQLMDLGVSPHIAVVLDVTADHLDYHKDLAEYHNAKIEIVRHQKKDDWLITTHSNPLKDLFVASTKARSVVVDAAPRGGQEGVWWRDSHLYAQWENMDEVLLVSRDELHLIGKHNLTNVAAAVGAALAANVSPDAIQRGIRDFRGNALRLELIGTYRGVTFINDGAATNPCATSAAAAAMTSPFILLLGGRNKGMNYEEMLRGLEKNKYLKEVVAFGEVGEELGGRLGKSALKSNIIRHCEEAIRYGMSAAAKGDTILFSPAAASHDEFKNYEERGQLFNKLAYEYGTR